MRKTLCAWDVNVFVHLIEREKKKPFILAKVCIAMHALDSCIVQFHEFTWIRRSNSNRSSKSWWKRSQTIISWQCFRMLSSIWTQTIAFIVFLLTHQNPIFRTYTVGIAYSKSFFDIQSNWTKNRKTQWSDEKWLVNVKLKWNIARVKSSGIK